MQYETLDTTVRDGVAVITLNRPDQLNALNQAMLRELPRALDAAEADDNARAVLLRANGRAFSSGADLKEGVGSGMTRGDFKLGDPLRVHYNPLIEKLRGLDMPVVSAVQGLAAGAGCSLALAVDMVVAGRAGAFQMIFSSIGLVPDAGATYLLPRLAGRAKALGAMLTGEVIDAERAERWGLIWQVVDDAELEDTSMSLAASLAARPTQALAWTRQLVDAGAGDSLAGQMAGEADYQDACQHTEDFAEAISAFMEKRPPTFRGR
ncbi:enoyl-CoA hydratase-related protein [Salinisphaera sp. P385]|uniref:Enoyl-CoA hydratase-related protein n=1 Tax=Spectribacter acetivorans TaxID=3075603 RepID=A0ABU3BA19_9GAMM|nr:enoyl-CoA hydratase-related protein [Salinisphaera sp. P385]MDT0619316.1 enoyl-CoA hydratase-related protein [Salinisphaera sp. P385]